jgi:hypothetical protein
MYQAHMWYLAPLSPLSQQLKSRRWAIIIMRRSLELISSGPSTSLMQSNSLRYGPPNLRRLLRKQESMDSSSVRHLLVRTLWSTLPISKSNLWWRWTSLTRTSWTRGIVGMVIQLYSNRRLRSHYRHQVEPQVRSLSLVAILLLLNWLTKKRMRPSSTYSLFRGSLITWSRNRSKITKMKN